VFAPANLPGDLLAKLSREIARIIKLPEMSEQLTAQGAIPVANSSDEFGAFIRQEMEVWGNLAQRVGLRPD
jgi:tripartite-type tricarboxylate transporter receptor subunit TctC